MVSFLKGNGIAIFSLTIAAITFFLTQVREPQIEPILADRIQVVCEEEGRCGGA